MKQVVKVAGVTMNLNGQEYVVPPLSLGVLDQIKDRIGNFDKAPFAEQVELTISVAHAALKRNYPDLTREEVGDMLDVANMMEVFGAVMDVSGLKRKEQEAAQAGEAAAAG
ncbi:phage associated protein [Bergeriella denitrificans]|uniref:Phage associated protein n=2 Tax=Bergeriella denitrificans TaxID=494 RepID=A0A378UJ84_BERDE|nr:phage associated protein [Bergeriella denitrificans]